MKKIESKHYLKLAQLAHQDVSYIDDAYDEDDDGSNNDYNGPGSAKYYESDPNGTAKYKGKWVPHVTTDKASGYIEFQISVIREDYKGGFRSQGWDAELLDPTAAKLFFADGKIHAKYASSYIPQLCETAQLFANELNQKDAAKNVTPQQNGKTNVV